MFYQIRHSNYKGAGGIIFLEAFLIGLDGTPDTHYLLYVMKTDLPPEDASAMVAGLTPKAVKMMVETEEIRRSAAEAASDGIIEPERVQACAARLLTAFSSAARSGYRPDSTKPVFLGVSALKVLLAEFSDFPEPPQRISNSAFNLDGYDHLVQWALLRSKMEDPKTLEGALSKEASDKIVALGTNTLGELYRDGVEHIIPSNDVPEDPSGARIEACVMSVAKACQFGVFHGANPANVEVEMETASAIANDIIVGHNDFLSNSEEIVSQLEEAMAIMPGKTSSPTIQSTAKGRR